MEYISERITNIADLELIIDKCSALAKIIEKEIPDNVTIKALSEAIRTASDFEFNIERRKTNYCE